MTKDINHAPVQPKLSSSHVPGISISMQTIFKYRQSVAVREHSEIFDTAYNKRIREGSESSEYIQWENHKHLLATSICTSVGISSIWRFPTYCYKYGGASFLYVYIFLTLLIGHPLLYFEIILGQITPKNPSTRFNICPIFEGLGWAMAMVSIFMLIYFGILCAYFCIYMSRSVFKTFAWLECDQGNKSCWNKSTNCEQLTPPEVFYHKTIMSLIKNEEENSWVYSIHWPVIVFLSLIWFSVYICIIIDIRTSRLIPTFLFIIDFLLMIPMIVGTQLTKGSLRGLKEYFVPSLLNFLNFELWWSALEQVLFSLGLASGTCLSYGAYSQFRAPICKDCTIICCMVLLASAVTGSIVFSGVGIMGSELNKECFLNSVEKGPGSVLIFYSIAFSKLPIRNVWAFLVYLIAVSQVIFTMVILLETVLGSLSEHNTVFKDNRTVTAAVMIIVLFLSSVPGSTEAGKDMIIVLDAYGVGMCLGFIAIFETVTIYFYGFDRLSKRRNIAFGETISKVYKYIWYCIPWMIVCIIIASIFSRIYLSSSLESFITEGWLLSNASVITGWCLFFTVMMLILVKSVYKFYFIRTTDKKWTTLFFNKKSKISHESFTTAAPKLVPTPEASYTSFLETNNVNIPGPSSGHWRKYYRMPSKYFKVFLSENEDYSEDEN